jgi:hypothetical protein
LRTPAYDGISQIVGYTTFDVQNFGSTARQLEHRANSYPPEDPRYQYGSYLHFAWTDQDDDIYGVGRGIAYQAYDISGCGLVFPSDGIRIDFDYAGYVSLDADTGGWAVIAANQMIDDYTYPCTFWDFTIGGPAFGIFTYEYPPDVYGWYQNEGTGPDNTNLWPIIEWDLDGEVPVLHMIAAESGGSLGDPYTISYYRRVGNYGTGLGVWSEQIIIDTIEPHSFLKLDSCEIYSPRKYDIISSPYTNRIAIIFKSSWLTLRAIYSDYNGQDFAESYQNQSLSYGLDMGNLEGGDIIHSPYEALTVIGEFEGLLLPNDKLTIAYTSLKLYHDYKTVRGMELQSWTEDDSRRKVIDTYQLDIGYKFKLDSPSLSAGLGLSLCNDHLYSIFGGLSLKFKKSGCIMESDLVNKYLYVSVFDPSYDAWDRPQRVTSAPVSPDSCIPGDMTGPGTCLSEDWASMARSGRLDTCHSNPPQWVLDILYINDYAPGGCIDAESGIWTISPVIWTQYPCREPVSEPGYYDDAGPGYGLCVDKPILVLGTTDDTSFVLTLENFRALDNNPIDIVITIDSGGNGGTSITATPNSGINLPGAGGVQEVTIDITTSR